MLLFFSPLFRLMCTVACGRFIFRSEGAWLLLYACHPHPLLSPFPCFPSDEHQTNLTRFGPSVMCRLSHLCSNSDLRISRDGNPDRVHKCESVPKALATALVPFGAALPFWHETVRLGCLLSRHAARRFEAKMTPSPTCVDGDCVVVVVVIVLCAERENAEANRSFS